jgi:hypothetical protein
MKGVETDRPPSVNELLRYNRQARRTARPGYRYKRTGDLREFSYNDMSYGVPSPSGTLFFTNEANDYVRPEEAEAAANAALAGAKIVEFDVSNPEVLNAVGVALTNSEIQPFLQSQAGQAKIARSRTLFDTETGDVVILDEDRNVLWAGQADAGGLLGEHARNPAMADVAGSAALLQSQGTDNALMSLANAKQGEQFNELAIFVAPGLTIASKPPVVTVMGELTYAPGQSAGELTVLNIENGQRQVLKIPIGDVVKQHKFQGYNDYQMSAKDSGVEPMSEKQFDRATRPPLFSPDRKINRQAKRARVEGGRHVSRGTKFQNALARKPVEAADPVEDAPPDGSDLPDAVDGSGGGGPGSGFDDSRFTDAGAALADPLVDAPPEPPSSDIPLGGRFYHNLPLPTPQFGFNLTVPDEDFMGPRPEQGGPGPTKGASFAGAIRHRTGADHAGRRFARSIEPAIAGEELTAQRAEQKRLADAAEERRLAAEEVKRQAQRQAAAQGAHSTGPR